MSAVELSGLSIPGYRLEAPIAEGTATVLYDAVQEQTSRRVAVKVTRADSMGAGQAARRMETEWRVGRALRHPHLVQFFDAGPTIDGGYWLAMEKLEGHDLLLELGRRGRLHPTRTLQIVLQLCHALEVLHRRGVVHRDIKPANIFLCTGRGHGDHVKLVDLGMLGIEQDDPDRVHPPTERITIGTPHFQAPEQLLGQPVDARADVYSVGVLMYRLLAGKLPFEGDMRAIMDGHIKQTPVSVDAHGVVLPTVLVELVHQCLLKSPEDRPANATELRQRLLAIFQEVHAFCNSAPGFASGGVPELPPLDSPQGRMEFRNGVSSWLERIWGDAALPDAIEAGLDRLDEVEKMLAIALTHVAQVRREGETAAAQRRAAHHRYERELAVFDSELADFERAYTKTLGVLGNAAERLERANRRYRAAVDLLRSVIAGESGGLDIQHVDEAASDLDEAAELRSEGCALELKGHKRAELQRQQIARIRRACEDARSAVRKHEIDEESARSDHEARVAQAETGVTMARHAVEDGYLGLFIQILRISNQR